VAAQRKARKRQNLPDRSRSPYGVQLSEVHIVESGENVSQSVVAGPTANLLRHHEIVLAIGGSPQTAGVKSIFFDFYASPICEFLLDLNSGDNPDHKHYAAIVPLAT
jgi:hypothetical protein